MHLPSHNINLKNCCLLVVEWRLIVEVLDEDSGPPMDRGNHHA